MRDARWLLAVLLAAGCADQATSLDVTVRFADLGSPVDHLAVVVLLDGTTLTMRTDVRVRERTRSLRSGDNFVVLLPDAVEGRTVTVRIESGGAVPLRGEGSAVAVRRRRVGLSIDLTGPSDGGVDGAQDAATDGRFPCTPGCANGVEITCGTDGRAITRSCAFGCRAGACLAPDNCTFPADIVGGTTYADTTRGLTNNTRGSCANGAGGDGVTRLRLTEWSTVRFDSSGSAIDTILYTRTACGDPFSELPLAGPCAGAVEAPGRTSCNDDGPALTAGASQLVECGLPPGTYYTWIDGKGEGGAYTLHVSVSPVGLNRCDEAGNLLAGGTFTASTVGHANNFSSRGTTNCGQDTGGTSPDAIFFFSLNASRDVTLSTAGTTFDHSIYLRRHDCEGAEESCDLAIGRPGLLSVRQLPPGLYFVIVDGVGGAAGTITLTMTEHG